MGETRLSGPIKSGDIPNTYNVGSVNYTTNVGLAVLSQSTTVLANGTASTTVLYLPQQSQILGVFANTLVTWTAAGTMTVGTLAVSTAYAAGVTVTQAGQTTVFALTTTAANIGTTPGVLLTVTGTANATVGSTLVTLTYVQTTSTFS